MEPPRKSLTGTVGVYIPATVFKVKTDGTGYSVLHRFELPGVNGGPYAWLIEGTDGVLYGPLSVAATQTAPFFPGPYMAWARCSS
jgi:hypothetical protein